jgi:methylated-DNA-[protein]-cysteine S-methyltransferase
VRLFIDTVDSPTGLLVVVSTGEALCGVDFDDVTHRLLPWFNKRFGDVTFQDEQDPQGFSSALRAYFAGDRAAINALPTDAGGTAFQQRVWTTLRRIPAGKTQSYGALAEALGDKNAMRAVGLANGTNPVGVVVPCHRVVGANGTLTGYAGGLARKRWLLQHEGALAQQQLF